MTITCEISEIPISLSCSVVSADQMFAFNHTKLRWRERQTDRDAIMAWRTFIVVKVYF